MDQPMRKPSPPQAMLIGLAGYACGILPFGLLVVPGLFGYLLLTGGAAVYALSIAICAALLYILHGVSALYVLALIMPVSLCLYVFLRRKAGYFDTAFAVAALTTVLLYIACNLGDLLAGNPAFSAIQAAYTAAWDEMLVMLRESPQMDPAMLTEMVRVGLEIAYLLPTAMPAAICVMGALSGLFNLLYCVKPALKYGAPLKPLRSFCMWQLPKSFGSSILLVFCGVLFMIAIDYGPADAMLYTIFAIAAIPFAVQGIGLIAFTMRLRGQRMHMTLTIVAVFVILFSGDLGYLVSMCVLSFAAVGVLEQLMQLRRKVLLRGNDKNDTLS